MGMQSPTGWLAGTKGPTIADFMIVPSLQRLRGRSDASLAGANPPEGLSPGLIDRHPLLLALIDKLMACPRVKAWYASRKQTVMYNHMPRIGFGTFNNFHGDPLQNKDLAIAGAVSEA